MGEYTAIYEATNAILALLRKEMTPAPISKPELIGISTPFENGDFQLSLYLYQISQNTHTNTSQHKYIQESKNTQRLSPLSLELSILITPHSKAPIQTRAADELRILGKAIQVIRDNSLLMPDMLDGSLKNSEQPLHLMLETDIPVEHYNKLWSGSSKPYKLSFICRISPVSIDSKKVKKVSRVKRIEINPSEKRE